MEGSVSGTKSLNAEIVIGGQNLLKAVGLENVDSITKKGTCNIDVKTGITGLVRRNERRGDIPRT